MIDYNFDIEQLDFSKMNGLIPAVVQDVASREVRMVGFMNKEALHRTLEEGRVTFWSRSKNRFWTKGETSGNALLVEAVRVDCDGDALLVLVRPIGPTCHAFTRTCFQRKEEVVTQGSGFLGFLADFIENRYHNEVEGSYTCSLFKAGRNTISEKIREESEEVIQAALSETDQRLAEESADLIYHLLTLLVDRQILWQSVIDILEERHRA